VVHDFTKYSDEELLSFLSQNESACGRFYNHQLDRKLQQPIPKSTIWQRISKISASIALLLSTNISLGQEKEKNKEKTEQNPVEKEDSSKYFYGILRDDSTGEKLPFVVMTYKINATKISATTDINGNFKFYIPALLDTLNVEIFSKGFEKKEFVMIKGIKNDLRVKQVFDTKKAENKRVIKGKYYLNNKSH
jgi:hypothetical protein